MRKFICAIVVTHNRKDLLLECLDAIRKQTKPVDAIFIIDNFSQDGTAELLYKYGYINNLPNNIIKEPWEIECQINNLLTDEPIIIYYTKLPKNTGGAGGFYEGIKNAYERGYKWFWLLDDDSIPHNNCLKELFKAIYSLKKFTPFYPYIGFLCSKVLWTDGTPHLMNLPQLSPIVNNFPFNIFEDTGIYLVAGASFVSLLIKRDIIEKVGYPIKEFFIWGDDLEFTYRIIKNGYIGIYVKNSIVIHKSINNYSSNMVKENDIKYFYKIRNNLYILKRNNPTKYIAKIILELIRTLKLLPKNVKVFKINIKAIISSLIFNPNIQHPLKYKNINKNDCNLSKH